MHFHHPILKVALILLCVFAFVPVTRASDKKPAAVKSGFVTASDGVKIHYLEAGKPLNAPTAEVGNPLPNGVAATKGSIAVSAAKQPPSILFVPGWTMPAWIWQQQIDYFSREYRVVAMDPRRLTSELWMPIRRLGDGSMIVATAEPPTSERATALANALQAPVRLVVTTDWDIRKCVSRLFADLFQHRVVALAKQPRHVRNFRVAALAAVDHLGEALQRVLRELSHL